MKPAVLLKTLKIKQWNLEYLQAIAYTYFMHILHALVFVLLVSSRDSLGILIAPCISYNLDAEIFMSQFKQWNKIKKT